MSVDNISSVRKVLYMGDLAVLVTFDLRDGSDRTYRYTGSSDVTDILNGEDPSHFEGEEV